MVVRARAWLLILVLVVLLPLAMGNACRGSGSTPGPTPDVDDDGVVDAADQAAVAACLGTADVSAAPACAAADVDGDGDVDAGDEALVAASLGARVRLDGALRRAGGPVRAPFAVVGGLPAGAFAWHAASPSQDLREAPGALTWTTAGGTLQAAPQTALVARRVDPASGRPLRHDAAPGAACPTGAEAACWQSGDPEPGDPGAFEALCRSTEGLFALAPTLCAYEVFTSQLPSDPTNPLAPRIVMAGNNVLGGQAAPSTPFGGGTVLEALAGFTPATLAALNTLPDVNRFLSLVFGSSTPTSLVPAVLDPNDGPPATLDAAQAVDPGYALWDDTALQPFLTDSQEALLGCGAFWGSQCDLDGVRFDRAEAGALLADLLDPTESPCARDVGGTATRLPGCRGPGDPGYDVTVDGSPSGTGLLGSPAPGLDPFTGAAFAREVEVVSHNLAQLFAVQSLDWAPDRVLGLGTCTLEDPAACTLVGDLASLASLAAPDDPATRAPVRWLWEEGAVYQVTAATGELAAYQGWTLFVLGPERSRAGGALGVGFVLEPPAPAGAPDAPFVVRSLGADLQLGTADDPVQGVAYGVAP